MCTPSGRGQPTIQGLIFPTRPVPRVACELAPDVDTVGKTPSAVRTPRAIIHELRMSMFCGAHVAAPYLTFVEQGTNPQSTVGQSGCTSSKSSLGIFESPPGTRVAGEVLFSEENNGKARDGNNFEDGDTWRFPESKIPYPLSGGSSDPRCATSESDPCPTCQQHF